MHRPRSPWGHNPNHQLDSGYLKSDDYHIEEASPGGDLTTSKLFFPVVERKLNIESKDGSRQFPVTSHKAICRTDPNGGTEPIQLGIVGKGYKVVHNSELFGAIEEALSEAIPAKAWSTAKIKDKTSFDGAFCAREYIFPDLTVPLHQPKGTQDTSVGYRTLAFNTYDGSSKAKLYTGAIDWICANGMISSEFEIFARKHTSGFSIPKFGEIIHRNLESYEVFIRDIQRWNEIELSKAKAREIIESLPTIAQAKTSRRADELEDIYFIESLTRGETLWALYSALTAWATHGGGIRNTGSDHEAATRIKRDERVLLWINSEAWRNATKAA